MSLPRFCVSLLGRFELTGADGVVDLPSKKLAALLAYLACSAPRPHPRDRLAALLWGSHFDTQAKQNLRQALFRLRKVLGRDALKGDADVVSLNPAAVLCDVGRFEALVREGTHDALSAAADLYQGPLVDDVVINEEGWSEWLTGERGRLLDLALGALLKLAEQELADGRAGEALKAGRRAIALDSMREDAHRMIIRALAAAGRKAEALKHYQDLLALLKRELNAEPDAATRSLVAELRSPQPGKSLPIKEIDRPTLVQSDPSSTAVPPLAARSDNASPLEPVRSGSLEQRQLTIMVCSMVGSTPLARRDPEDNYDLIAGFYNAVADTVARFDGFVAQYQGNGVLVYFGYPAAREHDAEQAIRAGLAIIDAVAKMRDAVPLQASVGIASGPVVIGEKSGLGDIQQRVAIGETPHLAIRLQAAASPGEIVIAASTRRLVGRMFDYQALPAVGVGWAQPVEAWLVRGEAAGVSRFDARRAGSLSPFVGRQEEVDLLLRRWDQAKLGEGRVVLLSGEPGIGKSRIAESLLTGLEGEPHARIRYFCSPHHVHSPLYPIITQLERAAGFAPGSDASAKLDKLEAMLKPKRNGSGDVAFIAELLGVPADGRYPTLTVSPQQKRDMTLSALLGQIEGEATQSPVVIVVEDAHWIDPTSLDLLDRMVARAPNLPVLLVITFRPEFRPGWVGEPHVSMLPLSRLGRADCARIIGRIAKNKTIPDAIVEQILSRADGVPLFIEELTYSVLESQLLRETMNSYVLDQPLLPLTIPASLQTSLVARLDRLGSAKDLAQIAAVVGREFTRELIVAMSDLAPKDLDTALERLTASGLISQRGTPPYAIYSFKHALVQDAAYATLLKSQRRQLHASIAKALVERFSEVTQTQPELVAQHFTKAGLVSEAIEYWVKAGRLGLARWAIGEAVNSFEHALHALEALPESQSALGRAFDILRELASALILLGEPKRGLERLREAETLAERLNDDRRRGRVWALMTNAHSVLGELDEALRTGTRAREVAERLGDLRLRIASTSYLEQAHYYRNEFERVATLAADNLAALPADWLNETFGIRSAPISVFDRGLLIMSLAELGRFGEAAEHEAEALRFAEAARGAFVVGWAHMSAGALHLFKGDWSRAHPIIEHATAVMRAGNVAVMLDTLVACLAWVLAQLGRESEALSRLREGERLVERQAANGFIGLHRSRYRMLGRAAFALGRLDEARRMGELALESLPRQPGWAAHALLLLGDVASHVDQFDAERGEAHYRHALALAGPRGMRPLIAHSHLGLGKLYSRSRRCKQAQEHLTAATAMYREMDMRLWVEQCEAEIRQL